MLLPQMQVRGKSQQNQLEEKHRPKLQQSSDFPWNLPFHTFNNPTISAQFQCGTKSKHPFNGGLGGYQPLGGTNPSPPCLEVTCGLRPLFCLRTAPPLTLPLPCQLFFCFLPNFLLPHLLFLRSLLITRLFLAGTRLACRISPIVWFTKTGVSAYISPVFLQCCLSNKRSSF